MSLPKDYFEDLLVRLSHHSSAIENNTISLPETVSIILHKQIPNRASLREVYEIDNHRYAMEYLLAEEKLKEELSLDILFDTHELLMDRLHHERGQFKTEQNFIKGSDFLTASPSETPILMKQWIDNLNYRLEMCESNEDVIEIVCESHIDFERIHPFADGNGRTGRLMMNFLLLKKDIPPLIIEKQEKEEYVFYLATKNVEGFKEFAEKKIDKERKRYLSFVHEQEKNIEP